MAAKIILFLSDLKQNAAEKEYLCPNGGVVTGVQTNDAPMRYLLQVHPTVRRIICVVTKKARLSAWDHFRTVVKKAAPAAELRGSVNILIQLDEISARAQIPQRSQEEQHMIDRAKEALMEKRGFTEAQAHKYLQKRSMETGTKLAETARLILEM